MVAKKAELDGDGSGSRSFNEVLDSVLLAYRLAEDPLIRLPVLVNLDGFYLSFTREPVSLPADWRRWGLGNRSRSDRPRPAAAQPP